MDQGEQKWKHRLPPQCRQGRGDERRILLHLQPDMLFWRQKPGDGGPSHFYQQQYKDGDRHWATKHHSGLQVPWGSVLSTCS